MTPSGLEPAIFRLVAQCLSVGVGIQHEPNKHTRDRQNIAHVGYRKSEHEDPLTACPNFGVATTDLSLKCICVQSWVCQFYGFVLMQGCTSPVHQVAMATRMFAVPPNICGSSAGNLLYVTLLAPRILRWLLDLMKFVHSWFRDTSSTSQIMC